MKALWAYLTLGLVLICSIGIVAQQDWDAIEAAARAEGQVVIYSVSSRMENIVEPFMDKYGIEIIWYDMESSDQVEKFGREYAAGVYDVDVLYGNSDPDLIGDFLPAGEVVPFVPSTTAPFLDESEMNPFLVQRWSSRVLIYNAKANPDGPPINSLWDLTRDEWQGKVLTPDPLSGVQGAVYQTIINHPDEMAAAYEREFGEPITLSPGIKDAGEEWFYRFVQNEPVTVSSTSSIAKGVGDVEQTGVPPIGFTTWSKLRKYGLGCGDVSAGFYPTGYASVAMLDLDPVFGVAYPTVFAISAKAPHPNAAKLLIRYLVEDGYWPWNEIGDYASRSDFEALQTGFFGIPAFDEVKLWITDSEYIYNTVFDYVDFYLSITP
jgi:iron(III) transport system substrate-binding protein